jgi:Major tropism determinant N-terminal domain
MTVRIQHRRDTAANWTSNNPTLAQGEIGFETNTNLYKIGDGGTAWTSLSYAGAQGTTGTSAIQGIQGIQGLQGTQLTLGQATYALGTFYTNPVNASTYTLQAADANGVIEIGNASMNSSAILYVPYSSVVSFPLGTVITVLRTTYGSAQSVTIQAAQAGVNIQSASSGVQYRPNLRAQYSYAYIHKVGTDKWYVQGDIN